MGTAIRRDKLTGPRGLLVAIIATAYADLVNGNGSHHRSAMAYFNGDLFRIHLELLDLPPDLTPKNGFYSR